MVTAPIVREIRSFGSDLWRYLRIIGAMLRREEEIRRYLPAESFVELLEPVILLGAVCLLRYILSREAPAALGTSVVLFYASGFFPKYFFIYIAMKKLRGNVATPRSRFPVELRLDYVIVHILLRAVDYAILGVVVFGTIYILWAPDAIPYDFWPILPALGASAALGFGWGMLSLVLMRLWKYWGYVAMAANRLLILISGAMFVPDFLTPSLRTILSYNPELHAIALFRTAFYPRYPTLVLDTAYLTYCVIGAIVFGLILDRLTMRLEGR